MTTDALLNAPARQRVLVLGATGTIGQAAVKSLLRDGHEVVCFIRAKAGVNGKLTLQDWQAKLPGQNPGVSAQRNASMRDKPERMVNKTS